MDWSSSLVIPGEPDWLSVPLWKQDCLRALALDEPYHVNKRRIPGGTMGSWAVHFERPGDYTVTLMKLPPTASDSERRLMKGTAHLLCGLEERESPVAGGETSVSFDLRLEDGPAVLECWFTGQRYDGGPSGAYFVEVAFRS